MRSHLWKNTPKCVAITKTKCVAIGRYAYAHASVFATQLIYFIFSFKNISMPPVRFETTSTEEDSKNYTNALDYSAMLIYIYYIYILYIYTYIIYIYYYLRFFKKWCSSFLHFFFFNFEILPKIDVST